MMVKRGGSGEGGVVGGKRGVEGWMRSWGWGGVRGLLLGARLWPPAPQFWAVRGEHKGPQH